jgi:hypothetical protein
MVFSSEITSQEKTFTEIKIYLNVEMLKKDYHCCLPQTVVTIWKLDRDLILNLDWMRS